MNKLSRCDYVKAGQGEAHSLVLSLNAIASEYADRMAQEDLAYSNSLQQTRFLNQESAFTVGEYKFAVLCLLFRGGGNYR